jgi:hypothetical protein
MAARFPPGTDPLGQGAHPQHGTGDGFNPDEIGVDKQSSWEAGKGNPAPTDPLTQTTLGSEPPTAGSRPDGSPPHAPRISYPADEVETFTEREGTDVNDPLFGSPSLDSVTPPAVTTPPPSNLTPHPRPTDPPRPHGSGGGKELDAGPVTGWPLAFGSETHTMIRDADQFHQFGPSDAPSQTTPPPPARPRRKLAIILALILAILGGGVALAMGGGLTGILSSVYPQAGGSTAPQSGATATVAPTVTPSSRPTATASAAPQPTNTPAGQPAPRLGVSPTQVTEVCVQGAWREPLTVSNSGGQTLNWSATPDSTAPGVTLTPSSGSLGPGAAQTITFDGTGPRDHFTVSFTSNGGSVSVAITCSSGA